MQCQSSVNYAQTRLYEETGQRSSVRQDSWSTKRRARRLKRMSLTLSSLTISLTRGRCYEAPVKRALEVVRCTLNLAGRSWRDEHGLTWLETAPLITIPPSSPSIPVDGRERGVRCAGGGDSR